MKSGSNSYIKSFLPVAALIAGVVFFLVFAIVPRLNRLEDLKKEFELVNADIEQAGIIIASIPGMKEEIENLKQKNEILKQRVPDSANIPMIVREVSRELDRPGVRLLSLSPEEGSGRVLLRITLRTDFVNLGELMKGIGASDMLFTVLELEVHSIPVSDKIYAQMTIASFFRGEE